MKPRHRRLAVVLLIVTAAIAGVLLVTRALRSNLVFFLTPTQIAAGEAQGKTLLRVGGLVEPGSLQRDGDTVRFRLTDGQHGVAVRYQGVLPDLFVQGKGAIAQGTLDTNGQLQATEVLAKHDENYTPPEVKQTLEAAGAHPTGGAAKP